MSAAIPGYIKASAELIPRFEAISSEELYAHVNHLLPQGNKSILDIGAGTGRDAAWFAEHGQNVVAVEPVKELRETGITLHQTSRIQWLDDALPYLSRTMKRGEKFDFVMLSGVWQHLDADERQEAMPNLRNLTRLNGLLIMSLRHGPGAPSRPCFEANPEQVIRLATEFGFRLVYRHRADSIQASNLAAGVAWTWLAFAPD
jgi:SAM-dependent methyltransferase